MNIISFLISILITLTTVPLIKKYFQNSGIFDTPDIRSQHSKPIVRVGGIAIFASFIITFLINLLIGNFNLFEISQIHILYSIVVISSFFFLIGLTDDLVNLSPFLRLGFQFSSASIIWFMNIRIDFVNFLWFKNLELPVLISFLITIFWIVAITNAINWFDGLDGLSAGIIFIYLIFLGQQSMVYEQTIIGLLSFIVAGSCFAFLNYNYYPAKIIMGDGGSNFLGFILSIISILAFKNIDGIIALNQSLIVVSLPVFDMLYVILKRINLGKSPFYPDRNHLHHRLLNAGFSHQKTVYFIYALAVLTIVIIKTFL